MVSARDQECGRPLVDELFGDVEDLEACSEYRVGIQKSGSRLTRTGESGSLDLAAPSVSEVAAPLHAHARSWSATYPQL